ncbi:MAG: hypothetical protein WC764_02090 [Candidatus Paceibacterota bacterium]|jgi:hypothetical protein
MNEEAISPEIDKSDWNEKISKLNKRVNWLMGSFDADEVTPMIVELCDKAIDFVVQNLLGGRSLPDEELRKKALSYLVNNVASYHIIIKSTPAKKDSMEKVEFIDLPVLDLEGDLIQKGIDEIKRKLEEKHPLK